MLRLVSVFTLSVSAILGIGIVAAQAPSAQQAQVSRPSHSNAAGAHTSPAYPVRPPGNPEQIAHGKQIFGANCSFCHGSDARGGETGPNLVRSQLVLDDQHGELIAPVVRNGRPPLMPPFQLGMPDILDIAEFLHSLPLSSQSGPPSAPIDILIGDAAAGKAYFNGAGKCSSCHSISGDLAGIGAKYKSRALQNLIVSGRPGRNTDSSSAPPPRVLPTTVTVTLASGKLYKGRLVYVDSFFVVLMEADGVHRSFPLDDGTRIEVHNPLQAHIDMLPHWQDSDIHNLTKYLSTLK